jgi:hypothetical protein
VSVHFSLRIGHECRGSSLNWCQFIFPCGIGQFVIGVSSFFFAGSAASSGAQVDLQSLGHVLGPFQATSLNWCQFIFPCGIGKFVIGVSSFFFAGSAASSGAQVDLQALGHVLGPFQATSLNRCQFIFPCGSLGHVLGPFQATEFVIGVSSFFLPGSAASSGAQVDLQSLGHVLGPFQATEGSAVPQNS